MGFRYFNDIFYDFRRALDEILGRLEGIEF